MNSTKIITTKQLITSTQYIKEKGNGFRFDVEKNNKLLPAFAIRFENEYYAYLNICGHIAIQLDFLEGRFFNELGHLMCSTHGAQYLANTGKCVSGPCSGIGLKKLNIEENDGKLYLIESDYQLILSKS